MKKIAMLLLVLGLSAGGGAGFFYYQAQKATRLADKYMNKPAGRLIVPIMTRKAERLTGYAMGAGGAALLLLIVGGVLYQRNGSKQVVPVRQSATTSA